MEETGEPEIRAFDCLLVGRPGEAEDLVVGQAVDEVEELEHVLARIEIEIDVLAELRAFGHSMEVTPAFAPRDRAP